MRKLEAAGDLTFVLCGSFESPEVVRYQTLSDLADFACAKQADKNHQATYLVVPADERFKVTKTRLRRGGQRYDVDQRDNPHTIVFEPGGTLADGGLIAGEIATGSDSPRSAALLIRVGGSLTQGFKRIRSYFVGAEAERLLDMGARLVTMGPDEPHEYDLRRNED